MKPARVIGAGLSGLAAAWHLAERGYAVTVTERAGEVGGLIHTHRTPHGLVETAANAFVWDDRVAGWFTRLGLQPAFPRPDSRRRFIFRGGRPRRWPLSASESAGLFARASLAAVTRSMAARERETVADWGRRVLGAPATRWFLEPAMQGIYAAPAASLSARAIFGRRRGSRRLAAPAEGMGQFIATLRDRLVMRGIRVELSAASEIVTGQPTIVATGAEDAARLLAQHAPKVASVIGKVRVSPLTTVTMFFEPHPGDIRGFGILFPSGAGVHAYGVLHNADIFEGRGPNRSETWIVGDREPGMSALPDDRLIAALLADRRLVTGRDASPIATRVTRWPKAIPVYDEAVLAVAREMESLPPWLALAGNYVGRIGVAALLEQAELAANRVR